MSDRPILFSGPMVRAILDGRKTQTRRVLKPQPELFQRDSGEWCEVGLLHVEGDPLPRITLGRVISRREVRFAVGDRLWVRETWGWSGFASMGPSEHYKQFLEYRASGVTPGAVSFPNMHPPIEAPEPKWRPSIHMPRWASRLTLTVTAVKVERLQDISEEGARAEGITDGGCLTCGNPEPCGCTAPKPSAVDAFAGLWNSIHGKDAWEANPWVAAITFTAEQRNIDRPITDKAA